MSYHILHLVSHNLRVRLNLEQLHIENREDSTERIVPLADVAVIVAAAQDLTVTAGALRRMAELNVVLLVCNEKFEPCSVSLPYYRATNTELLRRQVEWSGQWKEAMWRQVIAAKIRNQATVLRHLKRARTVLEGIAERCAKGEAGPAAEGARSLATITPARRGGLHLGTPDACESRAARHYWKHLLPRLAERQGTNEQRRNPGTRAGVNGMLDYGYAILRSAVLRSLAAHGLIAAIGIGHVPKAGSFALADDLMEPLRPWMDRELRDFLEDGPQAMEAWIRQAGKLLAVEVAMGRARVRMLHAIDLYVESFAKAMLGREALPLRVPMLA